MKWVVGGVGVGGQNDRFNQLKIGQCTLLRKEIKMSETQIVIAKCSSTQTWLLMQGVQLPLWEKHSLEGFASFCMACGNGGEMSNACVKFDMNYLLHVFSLAAKDGDEMTKYKHHHFD